jgi:hypothetical protein
MVDRREQAPDQGLSQNETLDDQGGGDDVATADGTAATAATAEAIAAESTAAGAGSSGETAASAQMVLPSMASACSFV